MSLIDHDGMTLESSVGNDKQGLSSQIMNRSKRRKVSKKNFKERP